MKLKPLPIALIVVSIPVLYILTSMFYKRTAYQSAIKMREEVLHYNLVDFEVDTFFLDAPNKKMITKGRIINKFSAPIHLHRVCERVLVLDELENEIRKVGCRGDVDVVTVPPLETIEFPIYIDKAVEKGLSKFMVEYSLMLVPADFEEEEMEDLLTAYDKYHDGHRKRYLSTELVIVR